LTRPHRPNRVPTPPHGAADLDSTDDTTMIRFCSITTTMTTMTRLSRRGGVLAFVR